MCKVPKRLLPCDRLQIRLTKAKTSCFVMNKIADSKVTFKFLDAQQLVHHIKSNPATLLTHSVALHERGIARYNLNRLELRTFIFYIGSQSLSIDNAVLGPTLSVYYSLWSGKSNFQTPWTQTSTFSFITTSFTLPCT